MTSTRGGQADIDERERPRIQSVARALAILVEVSQEAEGLTAREIATRQGLRLPTAYHLIHTLVSEGFLVRTDGRRLRLGRHAATLGEAFDWQSVPLLTLGPHMRQLFDATGETAYLSGWRNGGVEVLGSATGRHAITVSGLRAGSISDPHARASGKLLLAHLPEPTRRSFLARGSLERRTARTLVDEHDLEREFETIRRQGYATDIEEYQLGVCCIAVPLDGGRSPFVIALSAPKDRFLANFERYLSAALDAAAATPTASGTRG